LQLHSGAIPARRPQNSSHSSCGLICTGVEAAGLANNASISKRHPRGRSDRRHDQDQDKNIEREAGPKPEGIIPALTGCLWKEPSGFRHPVASGAAEDVTSYSATQQDRHRQQTE